ncbi:MAG: hypothetical protein A3J27_01190 [Candidatus Tectomicrobia bacterium RIFCSPLOWO2_12_FULL_69_37]|nr:MAG: hypothetical protein A3J27_01190 [Candidatus Tectomicrobia bacterium RIFCSPLOWO2_12_FULL_69_37]
MLTNCHTLILRRLLGHGETPPLAEHDLYVYNVTPDSLPLSQEFRARETHVFAPPAGTLARYPKLLWVKCHIVVDNFCHYGTPAKTGQGLDPARKGGYTYRRGSDLVALVGDFAREMDREIGPAEAHYLAHVLVEIAVDYRIYQDDRSVALVLSGARAEMTEAQRREYVEGVSLLYGCEPAKVERSQGAPSRFYGNLYGVDSLFLGGRTKIVLRKLRLPFSEGNIGRTRGLILDAAEKVGDYPEFVGGTIDMLADRGAWAGEGSLAAEEQ